MDSIALACALGVEVYACDDLSGRGDCSVADGVAVIWVSSRLGRDERDHVVGKLLRRLRQKALRAGSGAYVSQAMSLH